MDIISDLSQTFVPFVQKYGLLLITIALFINMFVNWGTANSTIQNLPVGVSQTEKDMATNSRNSAVVSLILVSILLGSHLYEKIYY